MPVTVVTPAESRKLTTVADVKTDLGISGSSEDTTLGRMIDAASARIVSFCRREFAREAVTETLPGYGDMILMVDRNPIVTLTSVSYIGVAVDAANYSIGDRGAGHILNQNGWMDTARRTKGVGEIIDSFSRVNDYSVVYTGGFYLPSFTTPGSGAAPTDPALLLPADIETAARELAKSLYKGRRRDQAVKSESAANVGSVTYHGGDAGGVAAANYGGLPPFIAEMLLPYRRALI